MDSDEDGYDQDDTYDPLEDLADKLYPSAVACTQSIRRVEQSRGTLDPHDEDMEFVRSPILSYHRQKRFAEANDLAKRVGLEKELKKKDEKESSTTRPYLLIAPHHGKSFLECYAKAQREGLPLVSHKKLDDILMEKDTKITLHSYSYDYATINYGYWSGTLVATSGKNTPLPPKIECIDSDSGRKWTFPVPLPYQGRRGAYLFIDPPFYNLVTDRFSVRVCPETAKVRCLQIEKHYYLNFYGTITQDSEAVRIPVNDFRSTTKEEELHGYERIRNNPWRRSLSTPLGSHVGPIFRAHQTHPLKREEIVTDKYGNVSSETKWYSENFTDEISLGTSPSRRGGVIVEVPD